MKIGTLMIGGLAGAAIVMMIQRNQMMSAMASSVGQSMKHRMNEMKEDAMDKALNMNFASSLSRLSDNKQTQQKSSQSNKASLEEVEKLAYQDPHVTSEINSILGENDQSPI